MDGIELAVDGEKQGFEEHDSQTDLDRDANCENKTEINEYGVENLLGDNPRSVAICTQPWYYGDLLAWSLQNTLRQEEWKICNIRGYNHSKPIYDNIKISNEDKVNCLVEGQLFVEKDGVQILLTLDSMSNGTNRLQAEASESHQTYVNELIKVVNRYLAENNIYRGKRINLGNKGIAFLEADERSWETVILEPEVKKEIRLNTVEFLNKLRTWQKFGIPSKRGIILAGAPGTGKTIVCKALATEGKDITCLFADPCCMQNDGFFAYLYKIARDLNPCIIFIEDIDLIGQERFGEYHNSPSLISLLNEMDGLVDIDGIVTVATTNGLETLDKALSERPSRFDRIIKITYPADESRMALIERLSQDIPLTVEIKDYLVQKTQGFSPAQIQETLFSLVINGIDNSDIIPTLGLTADNVDSVAGVLTRKPTKVLGFQTIQYHCQVQAEQQKNYHGNMKLN